MASACLALLVAPAVAHAAAPIEGKWYIGDGSIVVTPSAAGQWVGTVTSPITYDSCAHPVGQQVITVQAGASPFDYTGTHVWYTGECTVLGPGPATFAVKDVDGAVQLEDCSTDPTNAAHAECETLTRAPPGTPPPGEAPGAPPKAGGTEPSTTCPQGAFRTTVGALVLCSTVQPRREGSVVTLDGRVTLNGFLYAQGSPLRVNLRTLEIHTSGQVELGVIVTERDLPLGDVTLRLNAGRLKDFHLPDLRSKLKLGRVPIDMLRKGVKDPALSIDLVQGSIQASATVSFDAFQRVGVGVTATGEVTVSRAGIAASLHADLPNLPLSLGSRSIGTLGSLDVAFDQQQDAWSFKARAELALVPQYQFALNASASLVGGDLDALALDVQAGKGIPAPFDSYIDGGGFTLANLRAKPSVGADLHGGWPYPPVAEAAKAVTFKGTATYDFAKNALTLGATAKIMFGEREIANGDATLVIDFDDERGELDTNVDVLDTIKGSVRAYVDRRHFMGRLQAEVDFGPDSPPLKWVADHWPFGWLHDPPDHVGPLFGAEALVSDLGAGAKTALGVWKLRVHATVWYLARDGSFHGDTGYGDSRNLDFLEPEASSAQARSRSEVLRVPRGRQALVLDATGSPSGRLVVRDPRGRVVVDSARISAPVAELRGGRVLFGRRTARGEAGVIVRSPRAGRWRIATGGPQPFAHVRGVTVAPTWAGDARVTGVRARGRVRPGTRLRVAVRVPAGADVQLRARRSAARRDLGVPVATRTRSGHATWRVPVSWTRGRIRFLAVTLRNGAPTGVTAARRALTIHPFRLDAPRRIRVSERQTATVVRWRPMRGAVRYVVTLAVNGHTWATRVRRPSARFPIPRSRHRVAVTVRAVDGAGRLGPRARTARGRARATAAAGP